MDFTPRKIKISNSALRHNPYASGGQKYINKYKVNGSQATFSHATPQRSYKKSQNKGIAKFKPRCLSRTDNIIQNSQSINKQNQSFSPSSSVDLKGSRSHENEDPLATLSDSEDEIFLSAKYRKQQSLTDKENVSIQSPPKCYKNKNKDISRIINKSNIIGIPSPDNAEIAHEKKFNFYPAKSPHDSKYKFKSLKDKENVNVTSSALEESKPSYPHFVGFPNNGNTCYLNAVVQSIVGLPCFTADLASTMNKISVCPSSISQSMKDIIIGRQKCDTAEIKRSLRTLKENLVKLDSTFSGFKMQDANEFLTHVLDAVKDEIDKFNTPTPNSNSNNTPHRNVTPIPENMDVTDTLTKNSTHEETLNHKSSIFDTPSQDSDVSMDIKMKDVHYDLFDEVCDISIKGLHTSNSCTKSYNNAVTQPSELYLLTPAKSSRDDSIPIPNPVKENFEFELMESYKCLGCNDVGKRKQKHFALYLNLPKEDEDSIQKAVESYTSEDYQDFTCEKCGHRTFSVLTTFTHLPRVLIVQMKRYEYKTEQSECIKVSSKVNVNRWLNLSSFTADSAKEPTWIPRKLLSEEKNSTLSVRNLSSELNIYGNKDSSNTVKLPVDDITPVSDADRSPSREEKELQEVMLRSIEDQGVNQSNNEEEEFQKAIQLSLLDMGIAHSFNDHKMDPNEPCVNIQEEEEEPSLYSYRLMSVISHFGSTTSTGHYVADVYNAKEGSWFHYDDESVSEISENVVFADGRKKNAYIYFYVHKNVVDRL